MKKTLLGLFLSASLFASSIWVPPTGTGTGNIVDINSDASPHQTMTGTAPIGVNTVIGTTTFSCTVASSGVAGCLSGTDYTTVLGSKAVNLVFASPGTGVTPGQATFRSLVAADIPALNYAPNATYVKADGTVGLSADWNAGAHTITATTFSGALSGNASTATSATSATSATTATNATNVATTATTANSNFYLPMVTLDTTGNQAMQVGPATYNPSTNTVSATTFVGALTGHASSDIAASTLTTKGDVLGFSTVPVAVGIGTDGYVATADSTSAAGWGWKAASGGGTPFTDLTSAYFPTSATSYVNYGNHLFESWSDPFSLVVWFRQNAAGSMNFLARGKAGTYVDYGFYTYSGGYLFVDVGNYNAENAPRTNNTFTNYGNWNQAVMSYNGNGNTNTGVTFYVNGVAQTNAGGGAISAQSDSSDYNFYIGRTTSSDGGYMNGNLDDISKWPCALTQSDVTALYNGGRASALTVAPSYATCGGTGWASSTRSFWATFEGNSWADKSGNALTGTPTNSPIFSSLIPVVGLPTTLTMQASGATPSNANAGSIALTSTGVLCSYTGSAWVKSADGSTACTF